MLNPHPFYRFQQGWNAGFYPDNQIVSDLLNELHGLITAQLPSWYTLGVTTVGQLNQQFKALINTYNAYPYYGNFNVTLQLQVTNPVDYLITIIDVSLYKTDATQFLEIYGEFDDISTKVLTISPVLSAFTPGSYSGSFDSVLVAEELKAKESLRVVDLNGSAVFPITYKYNATTFAAISGLARAKDLQLLNGEINRLPAATLPYQNQRTFELPKLSGDDAYIISIMERIIEASLIDSNFVTGIVPVYNSFQNNLPDGWASVYTQPPFTTYERVQFVFTNNTSRKFILVGRRDGVIWLWQRFVTDDVVNPTYDFMSAYTETTALPYEPLQSGRWLYNNNTFDFEFVEFTSGCYESSEFYAMPAKPGDQWQFNVANANLEGIDNALVGLFTESGQLIQHIGTASRPDSTTCNSVCEHSFNYLLSAEDVETYLETINNAIPTNIFDTPSVLKWSIQSDAPETDIIADFLLIYGTPLITMEGITTIAESFGITVTEAEGNYTFFYQANNLACGHTYTFNNFLTGGVSETLFVSEPYECICLTVNAEQLQASVTIPSKKGCYRMGIYNEGEENSYSLYSLSNIINIDASDCYSTIIEFWDDSSSIAQSFEYFNGWKQKVRIGLNGGGEKPIIEESLYRQSNGVTRRPQNKQDLSVDLHTDFFDLDTQLAMTDATRHPYLIWEGKSIFVRGDIEVATTQDFTTQSSFETLSQMKFQALIQGFQPRNSSCLTC